MPRRRRSSGYRPGVTFKATPPDSPRPGGPPWNAPAGALAPYQDPKPCGDLMYGGRNGGATLAQPSLGDAGKRESGGPTQSNSSCASEATQVGAALTPAGLPPLRTLRAARASAPDLGALGLGGTLNPNPGGPPAAARPTTQDDLYVLPAARVHSAPTALSLEQLLECFGQRSAAQAQGAQALAQGYGHPAAASAAACPAHDARAGTLVRSSACKAPAMHCAGPCQKRKAWCAVRLYSCCLMGSLCCVRGTMSQLSESMCPSTPIS